MTTTADPASADGRTRCHPHGRLSRELASAPTPVSAVIAMVLQPTS